MRLAVLQYNYDESSSSDGHCENSEKYDASYNPCSEWEDTLRRRKRKTKMKWSIKQAENANWWFKERDAKHYGLKKNTV